MDLVDYVDAQDREFERNRLMWEQFTSELASRFAEMFWVEYEYVEEPPPRSRRDTLLLGTVG